jgi:tRNA(His) guanylyltransferase
MSFDNLGDRMKQFEDAFRHHLPIRMPVIIRLDGTHFHSLTKGLNRPVDPRLIEVMNQTAITLCKQVQGCQIAYVQSDEISLLLTNYQTHDTQSWFGNNLQKMISVSAGIASAVFTSLSHTIFGETRLAFFDSRAFVLPKEEVANYFLWREQDATRNSIQMLARSLYSHKQCHDKNQSELQELIFQAGINWNECPTDQKRGRCIVKRTLNKEMTDHLTGQTIIVPRSEWVVDNEIPIFSLDRAYLERFVYPKEETYSSEIAST